MAESVSACLIVKDEEDRLPAALASVAFCDEIVVVDSQSTDRTRELAEAAGAKVVVNPWPGFGAQRNVAIDNARGDWILEVDADERVTPELRAEIERFLAAPPPGYDMGSLPLRNIFLGGKLGPSAKYPAYRYRLFRRGNYRHDEERTVHEGLWANGPAWAFTGDLEHLLAGSWSEAIGDAWTYTRLEARQLAPPGSQVAYLRGIFVRPPMKFAYRMLIDGGWRDGWRGFVKVALECTADSLVWFLRLVGHVGKEPARPRIATAEGRAATTHFARRRYQGPVRLVAVAAGPDAASEAADWLHGAAEAGADVALVTDSPPPAGAIHVRRVARFSPLSVIRGLAAEDQLRPFDALVPHGRRAERVLKFLPGRVRGCTGPVDAALDPAAAERKVRESAR